MQTALEILQQYGCRHHNDEIDRDDAAAAMREYAIEIIDEILTKYMPEDQRYASSGEQWCRVEVEPIRELKEKLK